MMEIDKKLLDIIAEELKVEPTMLQLTSGPENGLPEWDSFSHITLTLAIEDRLEMKFSLDEIPQLNTIEKIQTYLIQKGCL